MSSPHIVKLECHGDRQSLTLPEELHLNATEVQISIHNGWLVVEPVPHLSLLMKLALLDDIEEDFPENFDSNLPLLDNWL